MPLAEEAVVEGHVFVPLRGVGETWDARPLVGEAVAAEFFLPDELPASVGCLFCAARQGDAQGEQGEEGEESELHIAEGFIRG